MPRQPANTIVVQRLHTPLGDMLLGASASGVCLLEFDLPLRLQKQLDRLQHLLQASVSEGENAHTYHARRELEQYFAGRRQAFSVALHLAGTAFQQQVWRYLCTLAFGQSVSYQMQAQAIGRPTATRAVASANGANRIAILIPCHRVIGKNGQLAGYGGGLLRKQWLLQHERHLLSQTQSAPGTFEGP